MPAARQARPDVIVVGSGFGGAMAAHALVERGARVTMLERGDWVDRSDAWHPTRGFFQHTPHYLRADGTCSCVGGASIFYGAASLRMREGDFDAAPEIVGDSGAAWPIRYDSLEPHYAEAERLLGVAGAEGVDPTEPWRSGGYAAEAAPLAPISERIEEAATRLGLHPFRLPLALNRIAGEREVCASCLTCDGYACRIGAKNDLASVVLPRLMRSGRFELRSGASVTAVEWSGDRVIGVRGFEAGANPFRLGADAVVIAAGALGTPRLLLASRLDRVQGPEHAIGRYLMRHCNAFVYGWFRGRSGERDAHHKQIGINDFYFGDPDPRAPRGKLGNIQQVMHPQLGGVTGVMPGLTRAMGVLGGRVETALHGAMMRGTRHVTGLQVIAEDQPLRTNRVSLDAARTDRYGMPRPRIEHEYTIRDIAARGALIRRAREILREAGALPAMYAHKVTTFSHAVGTVRMGSDPSTSPLDVECRFRGMANLYVSDGSVMPTSGGVNPSLTIAANALRVGRSIET